jgi:hypothetical protein
MLHVELIQNEWAAGRQLVVARVTLNGTGDVHVESGDDDLWPPVALRPFVDRETGDELAPASDPERFLRSLHSSLAGDYLFATEAHEEGECEYHVGQALPLNVAPAEAREAVH